MTYMAYTRPLDQCFPCGPAPPVLVEFQFIPYEDPANRVVLAELAFDSVSVGDQENRRWA
jgi:hypothetical protein